MRYRKALLSLTASLQKSVKTRILPILKQFEGEYVRDAYAFELERAFDNLRALYSGIDSEAKDVSRRFISGVDANNKRLFYKSLEKAVGINLRTVVQSENLSDVLLAKTRENVTLIKSISDEYLKSIETIVFEGTTQGNRPSSMIKEIQKAGKISERKARTIARDQTSKLNSSFNQQRQRNIGVEEYVWVTADDGDVRPDHASKNGKVFRWDNPPKDTGHPGEDINCRCIAQPLLKI